MAFKIPSLKVPSKSMSYIKSIPKRAKDKTKSSTDIKGRLKNSIGMGNSNTSTTDTINKVKSKLPRGIKDKLPNNVTSGLDVNKIANEKTGDVAGILSKNNSTDQIYSSFSNVDFGKYAKDAYANIDISKIKGLKF